MNAMSLKSKINTPNILKYKCTDLTCICILREKDIKTLS